MQNQYYPFINLPLPYDYAALEPFIDEKTMHLHHDRHLQTYIDNLNSALKACPSLQKISLIDLLKNLSALPSEHENKIRNNAGGVFNHRFYFELLTKPSTLKPEGMLALAINQYFESFDNFKMLFKNAALSVFGSGYAWLVVNNNKLCIITTANQNTPLELGMIPILTIDVWEHAYYLKNYNLRANYIDNWFQIVNWELAEKNFVNL